MSEAVRTTCPYCGVGCGLIVRREAGCLTVSGDPEHPANRGRLCSKGASLMETLGLEGRLTHAKIEGRTVPLAHALDHVARGFARVLAQHGPDAVAFYLSGQLLTEDYYVANKLVKGFLGSANIDTNSRLCMSSAVAAHLRAFGEDIVPVSYADLEQAELVVAAGWNGAYTHPVLFRRVLAAREGRGSHLVVIDPRRTETALAADLHLPVAPGTDLWLWAGLLEYLKREARLDWRFLETRVRGFGEALARVTGLSIPEVARRTGLPEAGVAAFYRLFAQHDRTVTVFSQGSNQAVNGTDQANAIIDVHLATGRIGRPGAGPFSITGQPNAMGGREVGGLANQLAAHLDFRPEHVAEVARFWGATRMAHSPGLKAVDLFEAVRQGKIRALWIMGTNPAVSLPGLDGVDEALARCEFLVVSEVVEHNDTARHAHVLLPAAAWGEKAGTVTNSERRISRQRAFLPLPGEARPDWWLMQEVARRLGHGQAFAYTGPADIFREHARLTRVNRGRRAFDLSALASLSAEAYATLAPVQWPVPEEGQPTLLPERLTMVGPMPPERPQADATHPIVLTTGRVRDQWHTMTRTGRTPRLFSHTPEPLLALHPHDAQATGLAPGQWAEVRNAGGSVAVRVEVSDALAPGLAFLPMHWNSDFASQARVNRLVAARCDPISGQPAFKRNAVAVRPLASRAAGFLLARTAPRLPEEWTWVRIPLAQGSRIEFATSEDVDTAAAWGLRQLAGPGDWLRLHDPGRRLRAARIADGRLAALLVVESQGAHHLPRDWLESLLGQPLDEASRRTLLTGRPPAGHATSRTVCVCMGVSDREIMAAIAQGARSPADLGRITGAGTQCGGCLPAIERMLAPVSAAAAG